MINGFAVKVSYSRCQERHVALSGNQVSLDQELTFGLAFPDEITRDSGFKDKRGVPALFVYCLAGNNSLAEINSDQGTLAYLP